MSDQTMERIEKQLEGNSLALSAVAEVLSKMDGTVNIFNKLPDGLKICIVPVR